MNELTFENWRIQLENYIEDYQIHKKLEDEKSLRYYWDAGYTPVATIQHLFPDYWRF